MPGGRATHACDHLRRALRARRHRRRALRDAAHLGAGFRAQLRAGRHLAHGLFRRHGVPAAAGGHAGRAGRRARAARRRLHAGRRRLRAAGDVPELRGAGSAHPARRHRLGRAAPDRLDADLQGLRGGITARGARRLQFRRRRGQDGRGGGDGAGHRRDRLAQQRRPLRSHRRGGGIVTLVALARLADGGPRAPRCRPRRHLRRLGVHRSHGLRAARHHPAHRQRLPRRVPHVLPVPARSPKGRAWRASASASPSSSSAARPASSCAGSSPSGSASCAPSS